MIIEWIEERLEECRRATPGPWDIVQTEKGETTRIEIIAEGGRPLSEEDALFIISAREALPRCLEELRKRLEKERRLSDG